MKPTNNAPTTPIELKSRIFGHLAGAWGFFFFFFFFFDGASSSSSASRRDLRAGA
jgi:hypothetical protein